MMLNVTVDVSKYHDGNVNRRLANGNLYVDSIILQALQDYSRDIRAAWHRVSIFAWTFIWNSDKVESGPQEFADFLKPEFKDKLVLTYPNDDDAVLYAFDLIMQEFGYDWFEKLLEQNPRWVRGTGTPATLLAVNGTEAVTFTAGVGLTPAAPLNVTIPTKGSFVTWAQRAAIFKDAPHPNGAMLLHNFMLSKEHQDGAGSWSVRKDVTAPGGYPGIMDVQSTNPVEFERFMANRVRVERLKLFFEDKLGTATGLSPLIDDL
ncbi:hypothetical protein Daus18300_013725 [Diaporthe australafricana]|uniref:Uncharacterized protein n=1 Tax=Diaporthe australafricana TaxID=127596 RepID=A0ABR3VY00_9PEZI